MKAYNIIASFLKIRYCVPYCAIIILGILPASGVCMDTMERAGACGQYGSQSECEDYYSKSYEHEYTKWAKAEIRIAKAQGTIPAAEEERRKRE